MVNFQSNNIPQGIQTGNVFTSPLTIKSIRKLRQDEYGMQNYEINAPYEIEVAEDVTYENGTSKFIRFFAHADNDNSRPATYNLNAHILYYFLANLDNTVQIPLWNKCLINGQTVYAIRGTADFLRVVNEEIIEWESHGYNKNDLIGLVNEHDRFMLNDQNRKVTSMVQKRSGLGPTPKGKTIDLSKEQLDFTTLVENDWPMTVSGMHISGIRQTRYLENNKWNFKDDLWTVFFKEDDGKKVKALNNIKYPNNQEYDHLIIKNKVEGTIDDDPFYFFASAIDEGGRGIKVSFAKKEASPNTSYMILIVGSYGDSTGNKLSKKKTIIKAEQKKWDGLGYTMKNMKVGKYLTQDNFARSAKQKIAANKSFIEIPQDALEQQQRSEQQQHGK
jgi:hypothetical protein